MRFETRSVHVGVDKDSAYNSCTTPIYPSSQFNWNNLESNSGNDYTRSGNPTRQALEENIASQEGGIDCKATSTGMSAITAVIQMLKPGDHVVAGNDIYGGTYRLFHDVYQERGIRFSFVDMGNPENTRKAITAETKCVWIETPSNPLLNVVDIALTAEVARNAGAMSVSDNTFLSPYLQRPFEHGVDIVVHSTTKYCGGHSDVLGGFLALDDDTLAERLAYLQNAIGAVGSPFDNYLTLRGLKTLAVRMDRHCENAEAVAYFLLGRDEVVDVLYPGLLDHPGHVAAAKQMKKFGGMVSFRIKGGKDAAVRLAASTRVFSLAESLGAVESLIEHPGAMTHASAAGSPLEVPDDLIRLSVGIESINDLLGDLSEAFDRQ